jgi:hypothetical protein
MTNTTAKVGGKQNPTLQDRRVILIYKMHMHQESSMYPEHCTSRSDTRSKYVLILAHIKQIDQYEEIYNSEPKTSNDERMEDAGN